MNSGIYEAMVERMNALEARIAELEKTTCEPETAGGQKRGYEGCTRSR